MEASTTRLVSIGGHALFNEEYAAINSKVAPEADYAPFRWGLFSWNYDGTVITPSGDRYGRICVITFCLIPR